MFVCVNFLSVLFIIFGVLLYLLNLLGKFVLGCVLI